MFSRFLARNYDVTQPLSAFTHINAYNKVSGRQKDEWRQLKVIWEEVWQLKSRLCREKEVAGVDPEPHYNMNT